MLVLVDAFPGSVPMFYSLAAGRSYGTRGRSDLSRLDLDPAGIPIVARLIYLTLNTSSPECQASKINIITISCRENIILCNKIKNEKQFPGHETWARDHRHPCLCPAAPVSFFLQVLSRLPGRGCYSDCSYPDRRVGLPGVVPHQPHHHASLFSARPTTPYGSPRQKPPKTLFFPKIPQDPHFLLSCPHVSSPGWGVFSVIRVLTAALILILISIHIYAKSRTIPPRSPLAKQGTTLFR